MLSRLSLPQPEDLLSFWDRGVNLPRTKREPLTAITLSVLLGLAATGAGTGIASIITSETHLNQLSMAVDKDVKELQSGLESLKD